jgi:cyclopropane fatty-acyl-phospholipid synthase-like methyltransferase
MGQMKKIKGEIGGKPSNYRTAIYSYYEMSQGIAVPSTLRDIQFKASRLKKLIKDSFPADRDSAILELGCGQGSLIHFARQMGYRNIEGFDVSPGQVATARRLGIAGVRQRDALKELKSRRPGSLDVVVTYDFLEHFNKEEVWTIASVIYRALAPGGRWLVHVPNTESPFGMTIVAGDFTHETAFNRHSLNQLFRSAGFSSSTFSEDQPIVHGLTSLARFILWKLVRLALRFVLAVETGDLGRDRILSQNINALARK